MRSAKSIVSFTVVCGAMLCALGCIEDTNTTDGAAADGGQETRILIDGSSTVLPISVRMAEEYGNVDSDCKVNVASASGTGGGFKKFVRGETDINDASRPIKQKEIDLCKENGIEYVELPIATDGICVVVSKDNTFCNVLTTAQLRKLWEPSSKVTKWNELDPSWPDEEIKLYGPDTDSGTFDYFTEVINGESKACRKEYEPSTNDNVLATGVSGNPNALGYFGFAYYVENKDKLKAVSISSTDDPADAVEPTLENIESNKYAPLSRPLFIYVNKAKLANPKMVDFLKFYLGAGQDQIANVGYVRLGAELSKESLQRLENALPQ